MLPVGRLRTFRIERRPTMASPHPDRVRITATRLLPDATHRLTHYPQNGAVRRQSHSQAGGSGGTSMNPPIDPVEQFFSMFAQANTAVWPMQVVWYAAAVAAMGLALRPIRGSNRLIAGFLAVYYVWL